MCQTTGSATRIWITRRLRGQRWVTAQRLVADALLANAAGADLAKDMGLRLEGKPQGQPASSGVTHAYISCLFGVCQFGVAFARRLKRRHRPRKSLFNETRRHLPARIPPPPTPAAPWGAYLPTPHPSRQKFAAWRYTFSKGTRCISGGEMASSRSRYLHPSSTSKTEEVR